MKSSGLFWLATDERAPIGVGEGGTWEICKRRRQRQVEAVVVQPQCEVCRLELWERQGGRLREQGLESQWLTGCLSNVASVARGLAGGDGRAVGGPRQSWRPRPSYVLFRLMRWVDGWAWTGGCRLGLGHGT